MCSTSRHPYNVQFLLVPVGSVLEGSFSVNSCVFSSVSYLFCYFLQAISVLKLWWRWNWAAVNRCGNRQNDFNPPPLCLSLLVENLPRSAVKVWNLNLDKTPALNTAFCFGGTVLRLIPSSFHPLVICFCALPFPLLCVHSDTQRLRGVLEPLKRCQFEH